MPDLPPRLAHLAHRVPNVTIYALLDPGDGQPRWVGSAFDPKQRASQHWHDAQYGYTRSNKRLYEWLLDLDKPPDLRILEVVPVTERWDSEREWTLRLMADRGHRLFNIRKGTRYL